MKPFLIPDEFRAFMKAVVAQLARPHDARSLDSEDAFQADCGRGGRIDGDDTYRFRYMTRDGNHRWDLMVSEEQIRDIADGLLIEIEGEHQDLLRKRRGKPSGDPLLVWGEYPTDALQIRDNAELAVALDALHAASLIKPRFVRLWSATEDQLVAALSGDRNALYVIESPDGYATSMGEATLTHTFDVTDPDGVMLTVELADCVSWEYARRALMRFVSHGDLGDVATEGRIPSSLLMMGEVDRRAAISARGSVPREFAATSLRVDTVDEAFSAPESLVDDLTAPIQIEAPLSQLELAAWARRLLEVLHARSLIELAPGSNLDEISYQLGGLLQAHAIDAEHSVETADWFANEIGAVRGISRLFATGGDLQVAIRRSRES